MRCDEKEKHNPYLRREGVGLFQKRSRGRRTARLKASRFQEEETQLPSPGETASNRKKKLRSEGGGTEGLLVDEGEGKKGNDLLAGQGMEES